MNNIFDLIIGYILEHKLFFVGNCILSISFPLDDIIIPYLTGKIVNQVESKKPWGNTLVILIASIIILQICYTIILQYDAKLIPSMESFIRQHMLINLEKYDDGVESQTGEVMSRLVKIPFITSQSVTQTKNVLIPYCISFLVTSAIIFYNSRTIGLSFFIIGLIILILYFISPILCESVSREREIALAKIDDRLEDLLRNIHAIKTSEKIKDEIEDLKNLENTYANLFQKTIWCTNKMKILIVFLITLLLIITATYTYNSINNKTMNIGAFITIFMIITQWCLSLAWISNKIGTFVLDWSILSSYERSFGEKKLKQTQCKNRGVNGLDLMNLSYIVSGRSRPLLNDISIQIPQNARVMIKGAIGSGKSTFLKCIAGILKPTDGSICYNGKLLTPDKVGYAQQSPVLFDRTIYENIVYGIKENVGLRNQVEDLLEQLELAEVFEKLDHGIDTRVGKNAKILSGGQKQVIQLLRILLRDPDVLILDEVTSSLDPYTKRKIIKIIESMIHNKIVLMTTHDPDFVISNSKTIYFDDGQIVK